jgi:hypothetical protein
MKKTTVLSLTILLGASLAACAGDRNKQVQEATLNEAEASRAQREAQIDEAKKQEVENIEANRPRTDMLPEATQQRAKAESAMIEDRQKFQVEAQARLQKAQARLDETRQKVQILGGRAPSSLNERLNTTSRMTSALSTDINRLAQVSPAGWEAEKKRVEARLDDIEKSVDEAKSIADDLK